MAAAFLGARCMVEEFDSIRATATAATIGNPGTTDVIVHQSLLATRAKAATPHAVLAQARGDDRITVATEGWLAACLAHHRACPVAAYECKRVAGGYAQVGSPAGDLLSLCPPSAPSRPPLAPLGKRGNTTALPTLPAKAPPRRHPAPKLLFHISGAERAAQEATLTKLGARIASQNDTHKYAECSHLVVPRLKRSERVVCAVAAGKVSSAGCLSIVRLPDPHYREQWVLKPSFVAASAAAGRLVAEVDHEWGQDEYRAWQAGGSVVCAGIWPGACVRWRLAHGEALKGLGVVVCRRLLTFPGADTVERLVHAGSGVLLTLVPPKTHGLTVFVVADRGTAVAKLPSPIAAAVTKGNAILGDISTLFARFLGSP